MAVGIRDICVADLWVTPERNQLANFLPTVRQDHFYLVVRRKFEEVTFWTRISRPFMPFSVDGWLGICAFLCGVSVLLWLLQVFEDGVEAHRVNGCSWSVTEFAQMQFNTWHDFLLGQSSQDIEKNPMRKFLSLAFAFFVLVTLASYTASLASMLVVERQAVGTVNSIEEAVLQKVPICVNSVLVETLEFLYPTAIFVPGRTANEIPRMLLSNLCEAMILPQDTIDRAYAGDAWTACVVLRTAGVSNG